MSRSVREIFDIAVHLIDAQNESTGKTDTADTKEYQFRTPSLLNSLLPRVYPYSDTYEVAEKRPVHPALTGMDDMVEMDDAICMSVLPYGLGALLVNPEGESGLASFLWQMFEEGLVAARNNLPTVIGDVQDEYGGLEYGWFSRW